MRMRKHFATGAALAAAAALVLTACGGGGSTGSAGGTNDTLTAGVAYETTDYGPITTSALGMGTNWQVLEACTGSIWPTTLSAPRWPPVTP